MEDARVWDAETELWLGGAEVYQKRVANDCLMVLPEPPYVMSGKQAIGAVSATPRWDKVELSERQVSRPQEGLIVIAYRAEASQQDQAYHAYCTSTYRRLAHDQWLVVQHQQSIFPATNHASG